MSKGPITAIVVSLIVVALIYLFADIRPPKSDSETVAVSDESFNPYTFIESLEERLAPEQQDYIDSLELAAHTKELTSGQRVSATESLIAFYEENQQYNLAAFYHTDKAQELKTAKEWELAGDRQYSVSSNTAYNADFNAHLLDMSQGSYLTAFEKDTTNTDLKIKLANSYLDGGIRTMQGVTLLLEVVKKDSMNVAANLTLGKFGIISGQYDKAIKRLENILSLRPENTEALFLMGEAQSGKGNTEESIYYFSACRDLIEDEAIKQEINLLIEDLKKEK